MSTVVPVGANPRPFDSDPRWQLVERIVSSPPFQKSSRLRDLLLYLTEATLQGKEHELSEQNIGRAVFGKPADYSPTEDSSVRVYVRQLRFRLHEYFDVWGENEPLVVEIPRGNYVPSFRNRHAEGVAIGEIPARRHRLDGLAVIVPWIAVAAFAVLSALLWLHARQSKASPATAMVRSQVPWPLSEVFTSRQRTYIVAADANYGMLRIMAHTPGSLDAYLQPSYPQNLLPRRIPHAETLAFDYIANSLLTSYADVSVTTTLLKLAGPLQGNLYARSARDLRLRDLQTANYVFLGSTSSNPWVSLFEPRLNFVESERVIGNGKKSFLNRHPRLGEKTAYTGTMQGTEGEDYATISILPGERAKGSVLILQGLEQAGTEATGQFLSDSQSRLALMKALGLKQVPKTPVWFEALIHTRFMENAPSTIHLVEVRRIP